MKDLTFTEMENNKGGMPCWAAKAAAGTLVISILTGALIRIFVRKKPVTELLIWGILMTAMSGFLI